MEALVRYLHSISPLSAAAQEALLALFVPDQLPSHEYFVQEGAYATHLAFLETGVVRAYFVNHAGKEYNKQFFVGPSLIGAYTSLLTQQPNRIAQQALTDCILYKAPYTQVAALFDQFHDLERLGRRIAEYYFLEKEKKELEMALLDAEARYQILQETFPDLEQQIPQYHIASYLGISATQLSRVRKKMSNA
ncbi:MAG TPA: Crp/Fnr family transcriptional regulator [Cytophagales bacterium]|nr:Crp/Fnr family transcriptional regulator [Cytophagales bacterium]HAA17740.1 Crp/Fnr family transcriptional regulator [Cytophagales bacterium]HAP62402.1 Crp/Fnr family transcriptional regulator [Cytophagales bacterium]